MTKICDYPTVIGWRTYRELAHLQGVGFFAVKDARKCSFESFFKIEICFLTIILPLFAHNGLATGGWRLATGGWRLVARTGGWRLVARTGGWRLVAGDWRLAVAIGGWRLELVAGD